MDDVLIDLGQPGSDGPRLDGGRPHSGARGVRGGLRHAGRSLAVTLRRITHPGPDRRRSLHRVTPLTRAAVLILLGLAAAAPAGAPSASTLGRSVPLPSYCTGTPIPGGRLNLLRGRNFIILDATTNTIVNEGRCPLHNAGN